jgi:ATP phosphoribosyltransferase regulatory subunit
VADYFWDDARQRRALEASLLDLFRSWGYSDVITPLFEYADTIALRSTPEMQSGMVRFVDRDGSTLALRSDMTISIARLVGTRLHDWPMPQRFCYSGSVYRHTEVQAGQQREFHQAGIELIGSNNPLADAEVLTLTMEALAAAGLRHARLAVGHLGYFHGLLDALQLPPVLQEQLLAAVDRNSAAGLNAFLNDAPLTNEQRRTLAELPHLSGDNAPGILAHAGRLCLNDAMSAALANLEEILDAQARLGALESIYLDLTEIHDLGYYTGVTFEALTPQIGFPIASGGRYDKLVGSFGHSQAAVGVALNLDRMLLALRQLGMGSDCLMNRRVRLVVSTRKDLACLAILDAWRKHRLSIEIDVSERNSDELAQYATQTGMDYALEWQGGGFMAFATGRNGQHGRSSVPAEEAHDWIRTICAEEASSDS